MPRLGAAPRLRDAQRQVIVFLDAGECDAVRALVRRHGLTLGEALALAVNAELRAMGLPDVLTPARLRRCDRHRRAALPRPEACPTPGRRGRKSLAAWYDRREVAALRDLALECGRTLQEIARDGLAGLERSGLLEAYASAPAGTRPGTSEGPPAGIPAASAASAASALSSA